MFRYQPLPGDEVNEQNKDANDKSAICVADETDHDDDVPVVAQSRFRLSLPRTRPFKTCLIIALALFILVIVLVGAGGSWIYTSKQINGQSPPWYPSPPGGSQGSWQESYKKAKSLVEQMTLVEKVNITTGTGWAMNLCVGNTGPASRVGFPSLCLQDGPLGLRFMDNATSFPAGITVGSTWNRELMRRHGAAHGREAKMKGVNVLLGPSVGPLGRNPAGGRTWEGFGADPVLQGIAAYEMIMGIQSQGVMATIKHFVGNEQEHFRKPFDWGLPEALSSNIDDRTMHEIYAWPFANAIRAGVASIMCSYQMVNNSYACANSKLLSGILKDELGFQGFVQSDWLAQRSGVASALAGLDMTMPGDGIHWQDGKSLWGNELTIAVLNGSVPMDRFNDMAARIVASWYQLGQDSWDSDGPNFSSFEDGPIGKWHPAASNSHDKGEVNKFIYAPNDESIRVAREVAAEGTVLLKNEHNVLPLDPGMSGKVMIIGDDAGPGKGPNVCPDRSCNQGTLAVGWGSGATEFMYLVDPYSALQKSLAAAQVTAYLSDKINSDNRKKLQEQDLCLVFANADAGEGFHSWHGVNADRNDLDLQKDGARLIKDVADNCGGPTVAIIHAVGPVILEDFVEHSDVKAIIHANLPGQESGNALADVLFGRVDASGRLAFTIGKSLDDYGEGAKILYYPNHVIPQVDFDEGVYIDYRHFDKFKIEPRYAFGHGLSYSAFDLTDLKISVVKPKSALPGPRTDEFAPPVFNNTIPDAQSALFPDHLYRLKKYVYPYISSTNDVRHGSYPYPEGYSSHQDPSPAGGGEGGNPSLFEPHVTVQVKVANTGKRTGKEVVQLYVSFPDNISENGAVINTPPVVLRNFHKIELEPGHSETIELNLTRKDLSYWSVIQQNWVMPVAGNFTILVGKSSRNIVLQGQY